MNEYEMARLESLVRDWCKKAYRDEQERTAFMLGLLAAVATRDNVSTSDVERINTRFTYIVWHDGQG